MRLTQHRRRYMIFSEKTGGKTMSYLEELEEKLFQLKDSEYQDFHSRLLPGIDKETLIGIRTPILRKFAGKYAKTEDAAEFIRNLPHRYYEENNLHMMLITAIKDYDQCLEEIRRFLPYIDNWATCDLPAPKCFQKHKEELLPEVRMWISSDQTYVIRYGIGMLMRLYLDEDFEPEYLELAASVQSEEYYVNMMIAWYFATALAKQWEATIPYIEERRLTQWVHRKTIQKAVESYRITPEQKEYLKSFR